MNQTTRTTRTTHYNTHVSTNDVHDTHDANKTTRTTRKHASMSFMREIAHDDAQHDAVRDDALRATFVCTCDTCKRTYDANYVVVIAHVRANNTRQLTLCKRCLRVAFDITKQHTLNDALREHAMYRVDALHSRASFNV